jgi:hypothetical protein
VRQPSWSDGKALACIPCWRCVFLEHVLHTLLAIDIQHKIGSCGARIGKRAVLREHSAAAVIEVG